MDGTRRYRLEWGEADRPVGALRLRGPPVPGLEAPPELGVEPLYFRVPDTLVAEGVISIPVIGLGSGEPLLGIDAADLVLLETRSASWSVIVRTDGNLLPLFRLEGGSPPPPVITIDASLIPKGLGDAWLDVQAKVRLALSTDGGGYEIEVYRTAIASVPLRLTPP